MVIKIKKELQKDKNEIDKVFTREKLGWNNNIIYVLYIPNNIQVSFYLIGRIERKSNYYSFNYEEDIQIALNNGFELLIEFPNINKEYTNTKLFNTFASRIPTKNRKDIIDILKKYNLYKYDEFDLLKNSNGKLPIDRLIFI